MLGCTERDVALHWPNNQVYASLCQPKSILGETVCRYAAHALYTESSSKEKRLSSPFEQKSLSSVYPSVFLPGPVFCTLPPSTLPFLFRFSSGAASLEELLFGLPFTLPLLFQDHGFLEMMGSRGFVAPSLTFGRRSLIALLRGFERLSYVYTCIYIYGCASF